MEPALAGRSQRFVKLRILPTADKAALAAADHIAEFARGAVEARRAFTLALSGGATPLPMFDRLVTADLPWPHTHVFQTDERIAPPGDADRNLTDLDEHLLSKVPLPEDGRHPMPVDRGDIAAAAAAYERTLRRVAGLPPVLDVVHLGLGADGHTASLVPGDRVVNVSDREVAFTEAYQGRRRMTLTVPALSRARNLVWLVCGSAKAGAVLRLLIADPAIPAGRIQLDRAILFVDQDAAALLEADQLP
jgi:6-phosphogluconolactonase